MKQATLMLLIDKSKDNILLGMKKKGFGAGKFNGFGGKVEEGETVKEAAIREMQEESGVIIHPDHANKVAELNFYFPHEDGWDQTVHVFLANEWSGEPNESDEMTTEWFKLNEVPFEKMWVDDSYWMPLVFNDEKIEAHFTFDKTNDAILKKEIKKL